MVDCGHASKFSRCIVAKQFLVALLSLALCTGIFPERLSASQDPQDPQAAADQSGPPPDQGVAPEGDQAPQYSQQTPEQLQQLVAPIALYPDSLVAQILAASTFPDQVVEADRWLQSHADLKGEELARQVDQQPWDPSVKALTAFPSVLGNMDKNLSWTSSLGDAYYNQQPDVMDAVQVMRHRAEQAGNLKSTQQQNVQDQGSDVTIAPANPDVVYVPAYDPWGVYGGPIAAWPGWYPYPGIWYNGPYLSFGLGFGIGYFSGFGWGWPRWGFDWHNHYAVFNHGRYYSGSRTFYNRNNFYRGGVRGAYAARGAVRGGNFAGARGGAYASRGGVYNRPGARSMPFEGNRNAARGYSTQRESGTRSGAFSNYTHGGQTRSFSSRGSASFGGRGGGGGARGGGGGSHGGGRH
jgi:hypothetical protein